MITKKLNKKALVMVPVAAGLLGAGVPARLRQLPEGRRWLGPGRRKDRPGDLPGRKPR